MGTIERDALCPISEIVCHIIDIKKLSHTPLLFHAAIELRHSSKFKCHRPRVKIERFDSHLPVSNQLCVSLPNLLKSNGQAWNGEKVFVE